MDPANKFGVVTLGDGVAILRPPAAGEPVSLEDAWELATNIVRVATAVTLDAAEKV
jgi:hypothetical protein